MRLAVRSALFLLPLMILLPHLGDFPFQPGAVFSDLVVSHYPNMVFLQHALFDWGTIPLWSSTILSGYPFAANPLSGLFYLPGWLALPFAQPLGINLVVLLHLIWGGVGMYVLLRSEGLSERAALLGGLVFEALPKVYSHLGIGHITLLYAVSWTPWLLFAERRALAGSRNGWLLPGVVLGMLALADVRWAAYAGLLWLSYSLVQWIVSARLAGMSALKWDYLVVWLKKWLLPRLINSLVALLIAAPLLLPLVQYTRLSTRSQLTSQESFTLSMPPSQLFGLAYPNMGGAAEWMLYPGAVVLGLAIYVLSRPSARHRGGFWLILIAVTLIYSMGSYISPLEWLAYLPGMDLLRVPPRVLFLTGIAFSVIGALGFEDLVKYYQEPSHRDRSNLVLFTCMAFIVIFAAASWVFIGQPLVRIKFTWGAFFFFAGAMIIFWIRARRFSPGVGFVLLAAIGLVDIIGVNGLSLAFRSAETIFSGSSQLAQFIRQRETSSPSRIYSPSYSLPQHVAAENRLELADGVDPLQLEAYVNFMESATGVPSIGYSVTLPPFANANPALDNLNYVPDAEMLGLLNVKYVVAEFPLAAEGLVLLPPRFGQTYIYENLAVLPRAWVQAVNAPPGKEIQAVPQLLMMKPNHILLDAEGPGLLVLSELVYPGWLATIDGQPAGVETVGGLLRGVRLPSGNHTVQFVFRPSAVYIGLGLSALTWIALLIAWLYRGVARRRDA